jgi:hypothetical protein
MRNRKYKFRSGLTLVELVIAMTINLMIVLAAGALLVGGNRAWQHTYNSANKKLKQDALATTIAFGSIGRKANRLNYTIYKKEDGSYVPALPITADPEEVVSGDAVEFRYWDVGLDKTDSHDLMDVTKTATAYAFFYLDGDQLKVDYGPYPPGAVPDGGGSKNASGVNTNVLLAENVSVDKDSTVGAFSHTTVGGNGQGSVRINIVLTDPTDNETIRVTTATLMRNIWPR